LQGRTEQIALQVASPFGVPFRLLVELAGPVASRELLAEVPPGTLLSISGELEWQMTVDPRYALAGIERGRRTSEIRFRAHTIGLASATDEPGCDAFLVGTALTPACILRHPDKPIRIVATTVQIQQERRRAHSRAQIVERANVAVVVPLDHPMAPNLYRPGNQRESDGKGVHPSILGSSTASVSVRSSTARLVRKSPTSSRRCTATRPRASTSYLSNVVPKHFWKHGWSSRSSAGIGPVPTRAIPTSFGSTWFPISASISWPSSFQSRYKRC